MRESPERYYEVVKQERIEDSREPGALTVFNLNKNMERKEALLTLSIAILEVKEWFNVKGNMTDRQVRMTAEMILDYPSFYDLSLGNIKACFREKMMNEKLYDRLDGNIILGWLKDFKSRLSDAVYEQRIEEDRIAELKDKGEWRGSDEGVKLIEQKARPLDLLSKIPPGKKTRTPQEMEEWRKGFLKYKAERLMKKRNGD